MIVNPYLSFNGNCAEAVALYEKAFDVKAVIEINEQNLVGHAEFKIGGDDIMLFDSPAPVKVGSHMMITIKFDEADASRMKAAFETLKENGEVVMDICEVPWSNCFGVVADKFGINWNICQN